MPKRVSEIYSAEVPDIVLAVAAVTLGFAIYIFNIIHSLTPIPNPVASFLYLASITLVSALLTFILHEMMHKFTAQRFGYVAAFKASTFGLFLTLISGFLGFLMIIPGATMIYTNTISKKENGYISLAGPATNFVIFLVFALLFFWISGGQYPHNIFSVSYFTNFFTQHSYFYNLASFVMFINLYVAFFNMLPLYPLDGSKVFRWNKGIYIISMAILLILLASIIGVGNLLASLLISFIFIMIFSLFYRRILF